MRMRRAVCALIMIMFNVQHLYSSEKREVEINKPVNFTLVSNAYCISSMLQALIALPTWRSYIMNYPPKGCSLAICDTDILNALRRLVTLYSQSAEQDVSLNTTWLHRLLMQKKDPYSPMRIDELSPEGFLYELDDRLFLRNSTVDLFSPCSLREIFYYRVREISGEYVHDQLQLTLANVNGYSMKQAIQQYLGDQTVTFLDDGSTTQYRNKLVSLPRVLWIRLTLGGGRSPKILQQIYGSDLMEGGEGFIYQLVSFVGSNGSDSIAYVKYDNKWYCCNNLLNEPCPIVNDISTVFTMKNGDDWNLFYERVQQEPLPVERASILPDLHASLTLLGI